MADDRRYALQLRIGAFILASLVVFFAIVYLLGARARYFESKYELVAEFNEVAGLIEGATVRLAGVQIGRVTSVVLSPRPGGKVRVTMTVARRFHERIRQNSEARIATQGLLGDKIVDITPGSPDAPPLAPGGTLASQEPQEMSRMFAEGASTLRSVSELATTLRAAAERLDKGGTFDDIGAAVKSARRITDEVEKGKGWFHVLVYEEPEAIRRLNGVLVSTQQLINKVESGDNAVSVLLSKDSAKSARSPGRTGCPGARCGEAGAERRSPPRAPLRSGVPSGGPGPPDPHPQFPRDLREARARRGAAGRNAPGQRRRDHGAAGGGLP